MTNRNRFVLFGAVCALLFACPAPSVCGNGKIEMGEGCDDGNTDSGDGCESDCRVSATGGGMGGGGGTGGGSASSCGNGQRDDAEVCDDGNQTAGDGCEADCQAFTDTASVKGCPGLNATVPAGQDCQATAGDSGRLVTGVVLADGVTYVGGQVLVDAAGAITCAACDCSASAGAATAAKLVCPNAVVSPGLINSHDHISFQASPQMRTAERYEHRHDWRRGNNGHTALASGSSNIATQVRWAELRQVMAGTTSIVGATFNANGNAGMLRNLDSTGGQLGVIAGATGVNSDTFPLGDTSGTELTMGCGYPSVPTAAPGMTAYLPHVSEGIEASAHNEFVCLTQTGVGVLGSRTAVVHGIAVSARDVALMAQTGTSLVWSPRSNVSLYGDTAAIPLYKKLGVNIALGTDWTISGSMNLLRELRCADGLNANSFNHVLSDEELWRTVTAGAADATQTTASIGRIAVGKVGDLAIYKRRPGSFYRSIIDAEPQDVLATLRAGKVLYGDQAIVAALGEPSMCDAIDVCGVMKSACIRAEFPALTGTNAANTYELLQMANATSYPLFTCGAAAPMNEPSCVPERAATSPVGSNSHLGSTIYSQASTDGDKDGIADAMDNCPAIFNPVRPMDAMAQADSDGDGVGDVCDACPLNANTTTCTAFNPDDRDGDGVLNGTDNCPNLANPTQVDADGDLKGDACDPCPASPNPGSTACVSSIYAIKTGASPLGQPVSLSNVLVTAVASSGYFLQVAPSDPGFTTVDNSGLFVFQPAAGVAAGDRLNIPSGTPSNFFGQLQLTGSLSATDGGVVIASSGNPLPAPVVVRPADVATDGGRAVPLESVLVRVDAVVVTDIAPAPGAADTAPTNEFVVDGTLRVNDYMFLTTPFPAVGQSYVSLTGVLEFRNGNSKLEPRSTADIISGPPTLVSLSPALVFVREGTSSTLPSPLTIALSSAAQGDTAVQVTSSAGAVVVGDGGLVVVPDGGVTAPVPLFGAVATDGGLTTITASMGATTRTASVRVLGVNDVPKLVALEPASAAVSPGGHASLTARFDLPVASPTSLMVSLTPAALGVVATPVSVPTDAMSAVIDVAIDPMATGTGSLTVTHGAESFTATLTVQAVPLTAYPVISEFAPRGAGGGFDEFIELYNPTNADVDLNQWRLQTKSATATTWTDRVVFAAGATIASKGFLLTANTAMTAGYTSPSSGPAADFAWLSPAGGLGDSGAIRLVRPDNSVADAVGFGSTTGQEGTALPAFPGASAATRSFERRAFPTSTEATMTGSGSDVAAGNGSDTDNNATDFYLRVTSTREPQNHSSTTE
jgi:large repetitive protein